jgi:hypothetical protein
VCNCTQHPRLPCLCGANMCVGEARAGGCCQGCLLKLAKKHLREWRPLYTHSTQLSAWPLLCTSLLFHAFQDPRLALVVIALMDFQIQKVVNS